MQKKDQEQTEVKGQTLEELVPVYFNANEQSKRFKDAASMLGDEIKKICLEKNLTKGQVGEYKVSVSKQIRSSFDAEVLLECANKLAPEVRKKIVKVKEYVDEAELEKAVFLGVIKPEDIKPAQIEKEVVALRVTRK